MFDSDELYILKNNRTTRALVLATNRPLKEKVFSETKHIDTKIISQRIWHILNDIECVPCCSNCNSDTKWDNTKNDYREYCSVKCSNSSEGKIRITQQHNIEKYGVPCTLMETHTNQKRKDTMKRKYGVEYAMENDKLKSKQVQSRQTQHRKSLSEDYPELTTHAGLKSLANDLSYSEIANKYEKSYMWAHKLLTSHGLRARYKMNGFEQSVSDYIESFGVTVIRNYKKGMSGQEIDLFLPEYNIGIECNGVYWHSEQAGRDRLYHISKTLKANENGINLVHIWDNEWNSKPEISRSYIRHLLKLNIDRIYARNCNIRNINASEAQEFVNKTHFQGYCNSTVKLGLFSKDELVAVMTLGRPRYSSNNWELLRYSADNTRVVVGAAGKLFSYFLNHYAPSDVISYCDFSKFNGTMYESIGFEHTRTSSPCYWYTRDYRIIEHRSRYQKHTLLDKISVYDPALTEIQNMQANGYDRIWDCGNKVYIYTSSTH